MLSGPLESIVAIAIVGFAVCVFLDTYRGSRRLLEFLIGAAAGLEFGQVANIHLFTIACALYVVFGRSDRSLSDRWTWALVIVGGAATLAATTLVGDLVNSRTLSLQLIALAVSSSIIVLMADMRSVRRMSLGLLSMCAVGSAVAIGQRVGVVPYTPFEDPNQLGRVMGIWHEPDWLGMFAAIGLLLVFQPRLRLTPALQVGLSAVFVGAMILASARAAWIGLAVVAVVVLASRWLGMRPNSQRRNWRIAAAGVGVGIIVLVSVPDLRDMTVDRFGVLTGHRDQDVSVVARRNQNKSLSQLASTAPWHGHGLSAAGRVMVNGGINMGTSPNNVASNWVLGWWIDGKLLALPLIGLLLASAALCRTTVGGRVLLLVLVSSLASNAMMVPIAWFALGLALAEYTLRRQTVRAQQPPVGDRRQTPSRNALAVAPSAS